MTDEERLAASLRGLAEKLERGEIRVIHAEYSRPVIEGSPEGGIKQFKPGPRETWSFELEHPVTSYP